VIPVAVIQAVVMAMNHVASIKKQPRKRPRISNAGGLRRQTDHFARWIARTPQIVGSMFSGAKLKSGLSGAISKVGSVFKGVGGAVFKGAGKLFKPLDIAFNGVKLVSALAKGNKKR
jgi:hypothetical protein